MPESPLSKFIKNIPAHLLGRSGAVFYSGSEAFVGKKNLYILGLNPGGCPLKQSTETISADIGRILTAETANWSAYRDASWEGAKPGTWKMQPRVLHLLGKLGLDPALTPASNAIFVRTPRERSLGGEMISLIEDSWPFHKAVIESLKPKVILCFGKTAGHHLMQKLGATELVDTFVEENRRQWKSQTFANGSGQKVIVATHPSIADWTSSSTDPTELVRRALT